MKINNKKKIKMGVELRVTMLAGVEIENTNKVYTLHDEETFEKLKPFIEGHKNVDYVCIFSQDYSKIYFGVPLVSRLTSDIEHFEVFRITNDDCGAELEEKLNNIHYSIFEYFNKLLKDFKTVFAFEDALEYDKAKNVKKGTFTIFENV